MPETPSHRLVLLRPLFALLALFPATLFAATEIHLSPSGNDANPGTAALPVATPQGAQFRVRSIVQAGLTDSVDVIFAAGTYVMTAPLELRPEDSGTAAFPITWKAAAGTEVVLSGGRTITSSWTNGGGGIWFTDLTGIGLAANQWNFRQLFVNGSRATRARFPNVTEGNPFLYATGGDFDYLTIAPALVKSSWGMAADAQINVVPQSRFFNQWNTVTAVDTITGRIDIADSERHRLINSGSWFWIEGVQEELDQPGEWFLNPTTGRLFYMPPAGVDPNTLTYIAPVLNRLVNAKGDVDAGTHVSHVHFERLKFFHTSFTLGHIEARVHTDTAIMFENTKDSSVKNCYFENIGGYALWLHLDSQRNIFDHNSVQNSGGGGVLLTGSRFAYMDDSKIYTPGTAAAKVAPILNEITHNTVEHCGKIRYYGGGVHLDSRPFSMTMAPGNYIAHNHFNDLSRNGVFAFRNQGGNVIEYNHIHNAMQTTIDGGCVHFATMNTLNAPNHILNNWLYDAWGYNQLASGTPERKLANGVFLDWDTSNTTVKDNWIYNSVGGAVKVIFGGNRNVVQAGNQSSATVITPPFVAEVGPGGTATNGIELAANKFTGSVISYQDSPNFSETGTWTEETAVGLVNLFEFKFLTANAAVSSQAIFTLPIPQDGNYEISLIYYRGTNRASNVPVAIDHANGIANLSWNMQQGSNYGFAVPVGTYRFKTTETNTVALSTAGTNGKVIADAVAFVKIEDGIVQSRFISNISQAIPQKVVLYGTSLTATGAWVSQLQSAVEEAYPGMVTWVNSGGSGQASNWGVTNLQTKVINHNPDTVFIEFSMNDAATTLNISRAQALANLTSMVNDIKAAHPACEIILQIMNPVDRRETDSFSPRPDLALYQQDYRDFAASNQLQCIDHMPAFMALFDEGSVAYRTAVTDGVHPSAEGFARYLSPVLNQAIGLASQSQNVPIIVIDNADPAPAIVFNGDWTTSTATGGYIGADYRHNGNTAQGSKSAVFTPTIPSAGTYPIFLRWTAGTNRATNVPVTVNYSGGSQTVTVNQTINGGTWVALGTFPFAAGSSGTVSIGTTSTNGFVIADALGIGENSPIPTVRLRMDNGRAAEPATVDGAARGSSLIVWRSGPTQASVSVPLDFSGGSAVSGNDYAVLPTSITIPAGQFSAAVNLLPLHDSLTESDETFKVALGAVAGYATEFPSKASIVIENRGGSTANSPPVASSVAISGTAAVGQPLQGNYTYSDAESDVESGTTFRWLRSNDATLDVSDTLVGTALSYAVQAADVGKRLFFEVTPVAATGVATGNAAVSLGLLVPNPLTGITLVEESFVGSGALHATSSDTFTAAITTSGGSSAWVAGTGFLQNGAMSGGNVSAYLNLGSYLNAAKNSADGKFELSMTISEVTGTWISLGFGAENMPNTTKNFTNSGTGTTATTGLGTIIYRAQTGIVSPSANGELDMFGGTTNTNAIDGPNGNTGARSLTVSLDLTPTGGYNGTTNFGKVTWSDSVLGVMGSSTYTTNRNFGSILLSNAAGSTGTISALTLRQIMAATNPNFADWLTTNTPAIGFNTDSDQDGLPNGVEHVLNGSPNSYNSGVTEVSSTSTSITFKHKLNPNIASDVTYGYQWSTDLSNWHGSAATNAGGTAATITPSAPDANQVVSVTINITTGPPAKLFGRLEARLAD